MNKWKEMKPRQKDGHDDHDHEVMYLQKQISVHLLLQFLFVVVLVHYMHLILSTSNNEHPNNNHCFICYCCSKIRPFLSNILMRVNSIINKNYNWYVYTFQFSNSLSSINGMSAGRAYFVSKELPLGSESNS